MSTDPSILVDGRPISLGETDPHQPLLHFLRERGLTGVKEGCAEGECGACAVVLLAPNGEGSRFLTVNSCLVPAVGLAGREVLTVHGLAEDEELHPAQAAMVETGGSQCGYCTPGFVVSLFAEYYREGRNPGEVWDEAIGGNLCRCTGYRPIRDALGSLGAPRDDRHKRRLQQVTEAPASFAHRVTIEDGSEVCFHRPTALAELFAILAKEPEAKIVAGGTDVYVEINQLDKRWPVLVALEGITEMQSVTEDDDALTIGAGVSLSRVEDELGEKVPIFGELFPLFSSRLIRNRATLGGNLINASPIGDSPPALLALDARVVLASAEGERELPISELFTGYRETALKAGEILKAVVLPKPFPHVQRFYKVSKRIMDDISTVAAGFGLWLDESGTITKARLGYGGVAATPARATEAENALVGRPLDGAAVVHASSFLGTAFTPMTDHRGSARYREAMVSRLLEKLHAELSTPEAAE